MFTVYILKNSISGKHYIGITGDLARRIEEHNRGQTKSTKQKGEWAVIYKEDCKTVAEARRREMLTKSYKGGNAFKKLLAAVVQW